MITYAVVNRAVHGLCIYYPVVHLQARFVTNISGVNQKGGLFAVDVIF